MRKVGRMRAAVDVLAGADATETADADRKSVEDLIAPGDVETADVARYDAVT